MTAKSQCEEALDVFSAHMTHARHLENYLLSFTQVFLIATGALWGYALAQNRLSPANISEVARQVEKSGANPLGLPFERFVFGFHLLLCLFGVGFVIRISVNFKEF